MAIDVFVATRNFVFYDFNINQINTEVKYMGGISHNELNFLLKLAKNYNLKQFLFLDCYENTVFNRKQVETMSLELKILEKHINIKNKVLDILNRSIAMVKSKDDLYLKIEGD
ncbi:hypothetical protein KAH94_06380 [bacterium]|nr:hypothetical protein [bacterium]